MSDSNSNSNFDVTNQDYTCESEEDDMTKQSQQKSSKPKVIAVAFPKGEHGDITYHEVKKLASVEDRSMSKVMFRIVSDYFDRQNARSVVSDSSKTTFQDDPRDFVGDDRDMGDDTEYGYHEDYRDE